MHVNWSSKMILYGAINQMYNSRQVGGGGSGGGGGYKKGGDGDSKNLNIFFFK